MKSVWVVVALVVLTMSAHAQETTTQAEPVAPSSCASFTQSPAPPDGASATAEQMNAAVAQYEAWREQTQATLDCRRAEVERLNAAAAARAQEYRAAQTENGERASAFQQQLDAYHARQRR